MKIIRVFQTAKMTLVDLSSGDALLPKDRSRSARRWMYLEHSISVEVVRESTRDISRPQQQAL